MLSYTDLSSLNVYTPEEYLDMVPKPGEQLQHPVIVSLVADVINPPSLGRDQPYLVLHQLPPEFLLPLPIVRSLATRAKKRGVTKA